MKILMIPIMLLISFPLFSQQPEYSLKKDYSDPDKINMVDASGISLGYYKVDFYDKEKVNVYNANGIIVGYFKTDYNDASKVNVYSTGNNLVGSSYKSHPLEIPQLTGMFDPVLYKSNEETSESENNNSDVLRDGVSRVDPSKLSAEGRIQQKALNSWPVSHDENIRIFGTGEFYRLHVSNALGDHVGNYLFNKQTLKWEYHEFQPRIKPIEESNEVHTAGLQGTKFVQNSVLPNIMDEFDSHGNRTYGFMKRDPNTGLWEYFKPPSK